MMLAIILPRAAFRHDAQPAILILPPELSAFDAADTMPPIIAISYAAVTPSAQHAF